MSIDTDGDSSFEARLLRPFDVTPPLQALLFGLFALFVTASMANQGGLQTRGVLDLQFVPGGSLGLLTLQGLINWLSLSLVLLVLGRWLSPRPFSVFNLFAFQAAARWPLLLSAIYLNIPGLGRLIHDLTQRLLGAMPSEPGQVMADASYMGDAFILTALSVPLLIFLLWMIWLMFHAYQAATALTGLRAGFSFVGGLAVAYVLARFLHSLIS